MMDTHFYAVIMAGGGGTRLWPLSRRDTPKQLLKIYKDKSLFRIALDRLKGLLDFDHIYVVTVEEQIAKLKEEAPELPLHNFLIEPMPKGTASVVGMAATYLQKIDPDAVMAVLTADHVIENVPYFQELLAEAKTAATEGLLVTLGIEPTFPATGYGYIEAGEKISGLLNGFRVKRFKEKPDPETAKKYLKSDSFYWNSGMFIWSVAAILDEFSKQMPELHEKLKLIQTRIQEDYSIGGITDIWETIQPQTIDYGIMEGASDVIVLSARGLGWNDVGSWDSLFEILEADQDGNIQLARHVVNVDSKDIFIQSTDEEKMIAVVGLKDIVIVDHENTLLICKRGETQKVRQVIKKIKEKGLNNYL
jgi:mannose-1-phosphate guanylyltransferase